MISLIHVEDTLLDRKLIEAQLRADGLDFSVRAVETETQLRQAIIDAPPDCILSDYSLPQFDGRAAMKVAASECPDIPVIIVTGALDAVDAVEILKEGATDFVLKDHLQRLYPVVKRALRESEERAARRRAEIEMRQARDIAESANRSKDHFLAVLSHELRTPLTPVLVAVQTIEADANLPAEFLEPIQMIRRNVQLEVKLIDDLLDLTRVSRGKLELHRKPTSVHDGVRQVLAICEPDLRQKRLHVTVDMVAEKHTVLADPARLHQILWNLIKNSVKFTAENGSISIRTTNCSADELEVSVTDTGIGIDSEVLPRLFDAFEQGGTSITRQFGGLGLGLAISRALAEQHGGRLSAKSEGHKKGATFVLRIPIVADPTPGDAKGSVEVTTADPLKDCRILLVDDHLDTARAMGRLLKRWGCEVKTADSVASALAAAETTTFDILVSDIGLPDGSGLELIQKLNARAPVRGIAVSGFGMEEDLNSSRRAGFAEHLVKPVDLGRLEATIRKLIASRT